MELALLLPFLLFSLIAFFQLVIFCRVAIRCQHTAASAARFIALGGESGKALTESRIRTLFDFRGRVLPPQLTWDTQALEGWRRPLIGISIQNLPAQNLTTTVRSRLLPRFMYRWLPSVEVSGSAPYVQEPSIPGES